MMRQPEARLGLRCTYVQDMRTAMYEQREDDKGEQHLMASRSYEI